MTTTLVLNKSGLPINIVDFKRVMKYIANEKIEILAEYEDRHLRTWDSAMNAPAVVRLIHFWKPIKNQSRYQGFKRKNVYDRDKGRCQYCNKKVTLLEMTFDHVIPKDQGGRTRWDNIVTACEKCNTKKANKTPEEVGMKLKCIPRVPRITVSDQRQSRLKKLKYIPHESWKSYIYWNIEMEEE